MQAENANGLCKNSSDPETRLQDIKEEPQRHIGPLCVKELAKKTAVLTTGQDTRDSLSQKRREGTVKSDKHCNLTLKPKLGPFRTVLCFPEASL